MAEYSLWHCLCYSFYAPQYLAGPTITFNAFLSHVSAAACSRTLRPAQASLLQNKSALLVQPGVMSPEIHALCSCTVSTTLSLQRRSVVLKVGRSVYSSALAGFAAVGPSVLRCASVSFCILFVSPWILYGVGQPGPGAVPSEKHSV